MSEVERIKAAVMLKGMELRVVEVLRTEIDKIQADTEAAVKKAIDDFDFDTAIGEIIHTWLEDKIKDMSINTLDAELFNIEPELTRIVLRTIKESLDERV